MIAQPINKRRTVFQKVRKQRNLSQFQAAIELGVTEGQFRNIETGRSNPSAPLLFKMANYFGVRAEELFPDLAETSIDINHYKPSI